MLFMYSSYFVVVESVSPGIGACSAAPQLSK
jgi:hypothetical protein